MDFKIRSLQLNDIESVALIEQASRPTPWSKKQFENELKNGNSRPLILLDTQTSRIIGYVIPWAIAGEIQIQNIVVDQAYRGKGLGSLLLNVALRLGLESGCDQAILEVRESNVAAIRLYRQYQFEIVGKRENYYRDGEAALLMTAGPFSDVAMNEDGDNNKSQLTEYREFISKQTTHLQNQLQFDID